MNRGDIVVARAPGDFTSKARPFLIVQANELLPVAGVVALCPISSSLTGDDLIRIPIQPGVETGLHLPSEIAVDLVQAVRRSRIADPIGRAPASTMARVDDALRRWLGL